LKGKIPNNVAAVLQRAFPYNLLTCNSKVFPGCVSTTLKTADARTRTSYTKAVAYGYSHVEFSQRQLGPDCVSWPSIMRRIRSSVVGLTSDRSSYQQLQVSSCVHPYLLH
jgi:hypothetical protein